MTHAGVQMFMDKLNHLINSNHIPLINTPVITRQRPQFQLLFEELSSMIQTLFTDQHQHLQKVNVLKKRFMYAAEEAQYIVDHFLSSVLVENNEQFTTSLNLDDVRRSFSLVKVELMSMNIGGIKMDSSGTTAAQVSFTRSSHGSRKLMDDETVIGLDDDLELIRDKLVEDLEKVDVVSIVGPGGIGKTTLATKVFNDRYVKYHFYVRVWVTVSQTYDKRDVLIQILESIRVQLDLEKDNNESRLREMVHKHLMGKRYLIVIDDIWHIETWDDLKLFFPHDDNGSRILLTSRLTEVAKHANVDGLIHHLGYMNRGRSWELLCKKVFHGNKCPEWSIKPGMEIVEICKGLPLAVSIIGGVLVKDAHNENFWMEIAYRASSYIVGDQNGCLDILALSYHHLPLHLRECFLYLGAFPEDYMYQVRRLIWLWVAEGFIEQDENRSLEDIAQGYLMDLIDRNLVIITHRSKSNGVVKGCKVHDLVRELCLKKAKEEGFFNQFPNDITTPPYKPVGMFINKDIHFLEFPYPSVKNVRSIMCFSESCDGIARCFNSFLLLRVLDLQKCRLHDFPKGIELLVHLRYLSIWISSKLFPSSICNFWNLQTLVYTSEQYTVLPTKISDLVNLRHLWNYRWYPFILHSVDRPMSLQTISNIELGDGVHNLQKCFPGVKELKCTTYPTKEYDFESLAYLEKLEIISFGNNHFTFPATLKALTLGGCDLPWSEMSIIQSLPNLQVLKLRRAFKGSCWNTYEQKFQQLKFLTLQYLDIKQWEAYDTSFPCLIQLKIIYCYDLKEIPLQIGGIPTLELIKIKICRHSVGESVRKIQEEQHDWGNYNLKTDISAELPS